MRHANFTMKKKEIQEKITHFQHTYIIISTKSYPYQTLSWRLPETITVHHLAVCLKPPLLLSLAPFSLLSVSEALSKIQATAFTSSHDPSAKPHHLSLSVCCLNSHEYSPKFKQKWRRIMHSLRKERTPPRVREVA